MDLLFLNLKFFFIIFETTVDSRLICCYNNNTIFEITIFFLIQQLCIDAVKYLSADLYHGSKKKFVIAKEIDSKQKQKGVFIYESKRSKITCSE